MSCRCELANSVSWKIPDFLFSGCIKVWFIFIISIYGLSTSVSAESPIAPTNVSVSPGYKELTVSWDWTGTKSVLAPVRIYHLVHQQITDIT